MKEALSFLDLHAEALRRIPVWLFSSGPTADDPMDLAVSVKQRLRLDAVGARDHHLFRGALDPRQLGFLERTAIKAARSPLGDFRDWSDVERWAEAIADPPCSDVVSPCPCPLFGRTLFPRRMEARADPREQAW